MLLVGMGVDTHGSASSFQELGCIPGSCGQSPVESCAVHCIQVANHVGIFAVTVGHCEQLVARLVSVHPSLHCCSCMRTSCACITCTHDNPGLRLHFKGYLVPH